jgi:thymidine kinase
VDKSSDILALVNKVDVVGIDEAQFFDEGIVDVCNTLALNGTRVIVAGLDMDYTGKPFGQIPSLLAIADYITKLHAICMVCGHIANYSYRKTDDQGQVIIGEKNVYEPRCRVCYQKH